MAPPGRITTDHAGVVLPDQSAEAVTDDTVQMAQEAVFMQVPMQEDYNWWQTSAPMDDYNNRHTPAASGSALLPAEFSAAPLRGNRCHHNGPPADHHC